MVARRADNGLAVGLFPGWNVAVCTFSRIDYPAPFHRQWMRYNTHLYFYKIRINWFVWGPEGKKQCHTCNVFTLSVKKKTTTWFLITSPGCQKTCRELCSQKCQQLFIVKPMHLWRTFWCVDGKEEKDLYLTRVGQLKLIVFFFLSP